MQLRFLGTRAFIKAASAEHGRHSAAMLEGPAGRVMLDCGLDWRAEVWRLAPDAVVLTHAHPDHAFGLKDGAPCPVYATAAAWETIAEFPIAERRTLVPRTAVEILGIGFEAFAVEHSTRCPAVGYRICCGDGAAIFYCPDVAYIPEHDSALADVRLYVGDGSSLEHSQVRKQGAHLLGHAPVRQQLTWCAKAGIPEALFTHCGREVVAGDAADMGERLRALAAERGLSARYAVDGQVVGLG